VRGLPQHKRHAGQNPRKPRGRPRAKLLQHRLRKQPPRLSPERSICARKSCLKTSLRRRSRKPPLHPPSNSTSYFPTQPIRAESGCMSTKFCRLFRSYRATPLLCRDSAETDCRCKLKSLALAFLPRGHPQSTTSLQHRRSHRRSGAR
jgi:hypothetical protein